MNPLRIMLLGVVGITVSGCATVRDENSGLFGRAPREASCDVPVLRGVVGSEWRQTGTRLIEGSVFMTPLDVDRIAVAEACSLGADAVAVSSEFYGVPFAGSQAMAVFLKRD
ncbi:MAG: hypothetical protein Q8S33_11730 [Myxococcales bacterium]|nr:hypothetical protein [Myxococcales bacterium]MDP3501001.1 hypothetical protein [Myxococcales bacterium]